MLKTKFRKVCIILIVLAVAFCFSVTASAAEPSAYIYNSFQGTAPIPDFYLAETFLRGEDLACGSFDRPCDLFVDKDGCIYVCDNGNDRIVVLDKSGQLLKVLETFYDPQTEEETTLYRPNGVFVDEEKNIYIADTESERVLYCDGNGVVLQQFTKPDIQQFSEDTQFLPTKVVADAQKNVYVQCEGIYQGLLLFGSDGQFITFYGSETVFASTEVQLSYIWKQLMNQEQREETSRYVPTEIKSIDIDKNGYIYTTAQQHSTLGAKNKMDNIRKLNAKGSNVLLNKMPEAAYLAFSNAAVQFNMIDIAVDDDGFVTIIDNALGKIMYFDKEMNLLALFGSVGHTLGEYQIPSAVDVYGDKMFILDQATNMITVLNRTEFGQSVCDAVLTYHRGYYDQTIEPWEDIVAHSANYEFAYNYLGNAYLSQGEYQKALNCFELGRDSVGYNEAYKQLRKDDMRNALTYAVPVLAVVLIVALIVVKVVRSKRKSR